MTKMLEDLEEVVRLSDRVSTIGYGSERAEAFNEAANASLDFIRTHHATIADMGARLEAAERDVARLDWLESQREAYGFENCHEGNRWVLDGPFATARKAIDRAMQETGR